MQSENKPVQDNYKRIAHVYDASVRIIPRCWRLRATSLTYGRVLEVGIGTGINLALYPPACTGVVGIDVSPAMLAQAREKAPPHFGSVELAEMDVQELRFASESFDCVLATFVFCTVPDPLRGLQECRRVLNNAGRLVLLEHTGSDQACLSWLMDKVNPLTVRFLGDHINRDTVKTVKEAGFEKVTVEKLWGDIIRLIVAER